MRSPPLIGKPSLMELGMLQIVEDGSLAERNELRIKAVKARTDSVEGLLREFHDIFEGIGHIKDPKTGQAIEARLEIDPEAIPTAQKPRHVSYHLINPLKEWLRKGEEMDIYEKVPENEAITWCSPLVVQPKPKYAMSKGMLEPHMIRASIDMRIPNESMKRSRCVQAPIIEDFTYHLRGCKIFSKLDLTQGYHQLSIDEETRALATFSTPWGNYRPKRLIFGAKSSQDAFDEAMFRVFGDLPNCLNQRDDILLGGKNIEEHAKTLRSVLQRARDYGVTFNKDKCEFAQEKISFFGHFFTKDGLKADPEKIQAILRCNPPESKEEVRSFLGMCGYMDDFIKDYAILTEPLRKLTRQDTKFQWKQKEQEAFHKLLQSLSNNQTMSFFDPERETILRTEASFNVGLSAGLFQRTDKGIQPIHFISRSLTETEKRYSQTEKDALAIKWAKNRLRIYLIGAPKFKVITAHKPLIPMFNKATAKIPPRIEKWVMDMQDVDYEVIYKPGKDEADPMDYLSRHPLPGSGGDSTEKIIRWVTKGESAVVIEYIQQETLADPILQKLGNRISLWDWTKHEKDVDIEPYWKIREELSIIDGMIYRMDRIVIPEKLQRKIIQVGHKLGHLGSTKTKQLLRNKYWFPQMSTLIDETCDKCYECKVATKEGKRNQSSQHQYHRLLGTQLRWISVDHFLMDTTTWSS